LATGTFSQIATSNRLLPITADAALSTNVVKGLWSGIRRACHEWLLSDKNLLPQPTGQKRWLARWHNRMSLAGFVGREIIK
jgi:hypothetical protein